MPTPFPTLSLALVTIGLSATAAHGEVTKAKALAFAKELEGAIAAKKGHAKLRAVVDMTALRERGKRGVKGTKEQSATFDRSLQGADLSQVLLRTDSSFHLVGFPKDSPPRLLFRRVHRRNLALSYVELFLEEKGGELRVVDAAITGARLSGQLRRQYQALVGGGGMSKAFFRVVDQFRERKFKEVLADWKNLTAKERTMEDLMFLRANSLAQVEPYDHAAHEAALKAVIDAHPKSLGAFVAEVELRAGRDDVAATLAAIDRLDKLVGDPYLDMRRSLVHQEAGDMTRAVASMKRALERDPRLRIEDEPAATGPVSDPVDAALIYIGVMGGATDPSQLDRIMDWKAFHAELGVTTPSVKAMSVADFARAFKANMSQRPKRLDAAGLEKLRPSIRVKVEGDLALVSAPVFRVPLRFRKVGQGWVFQSK
ncbi:MAG: hypothetical protein JKY65_25880 [Planctomycetes bacterium]|nr:hypothetical protein [Planctomycetota bacterium]